MPIGNKKSSAHVKEVDLVHPASSLCSGRLSARLYGYTRNKSAVAVYILLHRVTVSEMTYAGPRVVGVDYLFLSNVVRPKILEPHVHIQNRHDENVGKDIG